VFQKKALVLVALALSVVSALPCAAAQEDIGQYIVVPDSSDCENTILLKAIVTASNLGKAYSEYDNTRLLLVRKGQGVDSCSISMVKYTDGSVTDKRGFQCVFEYPFGNYQGNVPKGADAITSGLE